MTERYLALLREIMADGATAGPDQWARWRDRAAPLLAPPARDYPLSHLAEDASLRFAGCSNPTPSTP